MLKMGFGEVEENQGREINLEIEIEDFYYVESSSFVDKIDIDYEFDAPKYYDFCRLETEFESQEAELWFQIDGHYSPSRLNCYNHDAQDTPRARAKSAVKPFLLRNSSLMNPTASQLARQNYHSEFHWEQLLRRSSKSIIKKEKNNSLSSSAIETQATKRQKLEGGYLQKVARLKHHTHLLHKAPKKADANTTIARTKVTIPREPNLATAYRAERRRFKTISKSVENAKADFSTFKARPLNRKILKAPSLPLLRKSSPRLPEFQVFHLRTLKRAVQHASVSVGDQNHILNAANITNSSDNLLDEATDYRRVKSDPTLKERSEAIDKSKAHSINKKIFTSRREISVFNNESSVPMDVNIQTDKMFQIEPPIESFSKLSLASEVHSNAKFQTKMPPHSKGSKENAPGSLQQNENTTLAKSQRHGGINCQCGSGQRIHSIGPQMKVNRSLDIR